MIKTRNWFIGILIAFVIILVSYLLINYPSFQVSEEKCAVQGDDCWHSLAHETLNRSYCNRIIDNETREHCLEHIPEVNKENK